MRVLRTDLTGETELGGTPVELLDLVKALRSDGETRELDTSGDPSPYGRALASITSRWTAGGVVMSLSADGEALEFQGGKEELGRLASNIEKFAEEGDWLNHLHIEYLPGHPYISPDSEPLVLVLAR